MNLTVSQVTVTDGLLTSMKINCDIYCHRAPPLLITNPTVSVKQLTVGGACFITSDYADYTDCFWKGNEQVVRRTLVCRRWPSRILDSSHDRGSPARQTKVRRTV